MSSRVRLMFQDFSTGLASTGKQAFGALQGLYQNWAQSQARPQRSTKLVLKKVPDRYATLHPYITERHDAEPPDCEWQGPGFYQRHQEEKETPPKLLQPLPKGPKWLVALEMWERLSPTFSDRYRLFVSRDNRKQAWRRSLCNPFFQAWGYKVRPFKIRASKKPKANRANSPYNAGRWLDPVPDLGSERPRATTGQAGTTSKPSKPRVGIWT